MEWTEAATTEWLQYFCNRWAAKHYSLTMTDRETLDNLKVFALAEAETCPVEDLGFYELVAAFIQVLEVRLSEGWNIEVSYTEGAGWNIGPIMPATASEGGQGGPVWCGQGCGRAGG